jgi:hypothetical protein
VGLRLLTAIAVALVCTGPATAGTVKLQAKIVYPTQAHPGPNDPGRCIGIAVVEYGEIKGATSYSILAKGSKGSSDVRGSAPPFTSDTVSFYPALFKAPAGKHWVLLGSYSVGSGCADAEAGMQGRFTIESATATVPGDVIDGTVMRRATADDKASTPLVPAAGVSVKIGSASAVTRGDGYFYRQMPDDGTFEVSAGPGFCVKGGSGCTTSKSVKVPSGGTVDFEQKGGLEVSGTVTTMECGAGSCQRIGLGKVTVRATGKGGGGSDVTDADGRYAIKLPSGTWRITPQGAGSEFAPENREVELDDKSVTGVDFQTCAASRSTSSAGQAPEQPFCRRLIVDPERRAGFKPIKGKPVRFAYEGIGWDPKGGPITITWGGKVTQKHAAASSFKGEVAAEWPQRDRSGCSGVVTATQGRVTRAEALKAAPVGVVVFVDNDPRLKIRDFVCGGEAYLFEETQGTVIIADSYNRLFLYQGDESKVLGFQSPRTCIGLHPSSRGHVVITQDKGGKLQIVRGSGDCR